MTHFTLSLLISKWGSLKKQANHRSIHFALIMVCGLAIYSNTLSVPFYFDDFPCIVNNPVVKQFSLIFDLKDFQRLGLSEDIRNSLLTRIVAYLTFALNYRIHGFDLAGYHLVNLAIHLANALLVYQLVRLTANSGLSPTKRLEVQGNGLALAVALLFVAHPVQTNAVTYIVQRFESLATLFYLGGLLAYANSVFETEKTRRRLWYGLALLCTLLGMFTKETVFTLPVLIAVYDRAFLPGERRRRWFRLAPFFAAMIPLPLLVGHLASITKVTGRAMHKSMDLMNSAGLSSWEYFINQWKVIVYYFRLLIVPSGLTLDHDFPLTKSALEPTTLLSGLLLAGLLISGVCLLLCRTPSGPREQRKWQCIGFGIVWFFVTISMSSSIIPIDDLVMEYRLYLPSCGIFWAVAGAVNRVAGGPKARLYTQLSAAVVVLAFGTATIMRNQLWQDDLVFWQDAVTNSPSKVRSLGSLANAYGQRGLLSEALFYAERARVAHGHNANTHSVLAGIFYNLERYDLAIGEVQEVIRLVPEDAQSYAILGQLYVNLGKNTEAVAAFNKALTLNPIFPEEIKRSLNDLAAHSQPR